MNLLSDIKKDIFFIIALGIILAIFIPLFNPGKGGVDLLAYWSAAHLFAHGGNPYDQAEMSSLESQTSPERFSDTSTLSNAWNPPWLILIMLPVGILPYPIAISVWIFCNTLLIGMALLITWKLCMGNQKSKGILLVYVVGFLFVETLSYLAIGQITGLVLLGIVLSIWFLNRNMDVIAGIALLLTTIKPHITYFFFILVIIWVIQSHRWKVFVGFLTAALISMLIFWIAIPGWVNNYILLINNLPYSQLYTSTLGSFINEKFNISVFKYSAVLLIFLVKPLLQVVKKDGWLTATNLALLISVPLSPYGFNFDHIIILPVFVQLIAWAFSAELSRIVMVFLAVSLVTINLIVGKLASMNGLEYYWFFWIPIAFLVIFLITWKMRDAPRKFAH